MKLPDRRQFLYLAAGFGGAVLGGAAAWLAVPQPQRRALQLQVSRLQAEVVAAKIDRFIGGIESQIGWITQLSWSAEAIDQWRLIGERLLRQVPAVTELSQLDAAGKIQASVSQLAIVMEPERPDNNDHSGDPIFTVAVANGVYYGSVYFRRGLDPYMRLSLAGARRDTGVIVAEVNLKILGDVVDTIKVGDHGQALVIDAQNRLIAHSDLSLMLRNTDMSKLTQVIAARAAAAGGPHEPAQTATDLRGRPVLTAYAPVPKLGWLVFVELPIDEA